MSAPRFVGGGGTAAPHADTTMVGIAAPHKPNACAPQPPRAAVVTRVHCVSLLLAAGSAAYHLGHGEDQERLAVNVSSPTQKKKKKKKKKKTPIKNIP
eukprot:NODE_27951_length_494_cov_3.882834.p2 GENE.NODE_27951_length_494_cov_3.882834~~NODE_27951_length_494_cov_3.882834.p2  ORF type:complete len:98 (-),score=32.74 NODE_27951_length_494_cov_3.882834:65-358(-)